MSLYSPLSAASTALYTALNVAGLTALATGGIYDFVPQQTTFPFVSFSLMETDAGGMGTKPGTKSVWQLDLRVHVYSQSRGYKDSHAILAKVKELLASAPASITGGYSWALFWDDAMPVGEQDVAGVRCLELVANARWFVEEA